MAGGQLQTLTRLREAVGADSEPWAAVQRGLIARHLGGEGRDLGSRLDYLLRGEGRTLLPFLTEGQRIGLGRLRGAVQQAESARMPVPTWASDLERTGFDPNSVARSIFGGSGALGAKPGAANEAAGGQGVPRADSQEWAGLRQAAVQRLIDPATPATKMIAGLRNFTDGAGKGVASTLFSPEELGHLRRFSTALQATIGRMARSSRVRLAKLAGGCGEGHGSDCGCGSVQGRRDRCGGRGLWCQGRDAGDRGRAWCRERTAVVRGRGAADAGSSARAAARSSRSERRAGAGAAVGASDHQDGGEHAARQQDGEEHRGSALRPGLSARQHEGVQEGVDDDDAESLAGHRDAKQVQAACAAVVEPEISE